MLLTHASILLFVSLVTERYRTVLIHHAFIQHPITIDIIGKIGLIGLFISPYFRF